MTFQTAGREPGLLVWWLYSMVEIIGVTVKTVISDSVETDTRFRLVAIRTRTASVYSRQWKAVLLV
jgi:hypothetical protein